MNATAVTFLGEKQADYAATSEQAQSIGFQRSIAHFGKKYGIISIHRSLPFQSLALWQGCVEPGDPLRAVEIYRQRTSGGWLARAC